jgi:hypothetical protein
MCSWFPDMTCVHIYYTKSISKGSPQTVPIGPLRSARTDQAQKRNPMAALTVPFGLGASLGANGQCPLWSAPSLVVSHTELLYPHISLQLAPPTSLTTPALVRHRCFLAISAPHDVGNPAKPAAVVLPFFGQVRARVPEYIVEAELGISLSTSSSLPL